MRGLKMYNIMVWEGLDEKVTFEQRPKEDGSTGRVM